jgi:hypothetical protein
VGFMKAHLTLCRFPLFSSYSPLCFTAHVDGWLLVRRMLTLIHWPSLEVHHRLNNELDLQSLFCTLCAQLYSLAETP